jgi:hypothetical protein
MVTFNIHIHLQFSWISQESNGKSLETCSFAMPSREKMWEKMAEFLKNEMWNPHLVQLSFQEACERKWKLVTVLGYKWPFTGPMMDSVALNCSTNRSGSQITPNLVKLLYIEISATIQSQPSWFLNHIRTLGTWVNGTYTLLSLMKKREKHWIQHPIRPYAW